MIRCHDGVERESSSPSTNRTKRSLYELRTTRIIQLSDSKSRVILGKAVVNGYQTRMADVKWEQARYRLCFRVCSRLAFAEIVTRSLDSHICVHAKLFDAVLHFCYSFSYKAAAAVYNALVHAIPPRTRVPVLFRIAAGEGRNREGATTILYRERITAA